MTDENGDHLFALIAAKWELTDGGGGDDEK